MRYNSGGDGNEHPLQPDIGFGGFFLMRTNHSMIA